METETDTYIRFIDTLRIVLIFLLGVGVPLVLSVGWIVNETRRIGPHVRWFTLSITISMFVMIGETLVWMHQGFNPFLVAKVAFVLSFYAGMACLYREYLRPK